VEDTTLESGFHTEEEAIGWIKNHGYAYSGTYEYESRNTKDMIASKKTADGKGD